MKKIAIMILLNMAALGASAQVMEREATGSPRFCQEFQTTYDGVEKINPTIQFVYDRFNEALSTAGMPQLVLKSCQRTKIERHLFGFKTYHYKYAIGFTDKGQCSGNIAKIIKVDLTGLRQLESSASEKVMKLIEDLTKTLGIQLIATDVEGFGYFFNSVTIGLKDCQIPANY